ncbi:MAG: hypothetical protein KAV80_02340, partial [Methanomicrobia archaeon]|nr:hypothetical protein [Methanomicrobia archaeon]
MKKKFAIKKVHIKGGVLGGGIGAILASLFLFRGMSGFLIAIGGFVGIYVVRKQIKLSYLEGMKIGLISALTAFLYMFLRLELDVITAKNEILKHGIEAYIEKHNITGVTDLQVFEDQILNYAHLNSVLWTLPVLVIMLTGTW